MYLGILNSGGYNINSIRFALNRIGVNNIIIVSNVKQFEECDKIIIPGVGHAEIAMQLLSSQNLIESIKNTKKPILGICLGMQIMFNSSEEGNINCMGIFNNNIIKLPNNVRIPQMGWNKLIDSQYNSEFVYFANSYYAPISEHTEAYVNYEGIKISAIIKKDNFFGCQFHPEKSGQIGAKILTDFINI